jgi:hypothetical protein
MLELETLLAMTGGLAGPYVPTGALAEEETVLLLP